MVYLRSLSLSAVKWQYGNIAGVAHTTAAAEGGCRSPKVLKVERITSWSWSTLENGESVDGTARVSSCKCNNEWGRFVNALAMWRWQWRSHPWATANYSAAVNYGLMKPFYVVLFVQRGIFRRRGCFCR